MQAGCTLLRRITTSYARLCIQGVRTISTKEFVFSGHASSTTSKFEMIRPELQQPVPMYQVLDNDGNLLEADSEPQFSKDQLLGMFRGMVLSNTMDRILYESQRQGRISFYITNYGEEACQVGSASALDPGDFVYGQYREVGVLLWRGFTLDQLMDQCYSNSDDLGKGRQMPVHYGSKEHNFSTISSPLGTQLPIAVGSACSFKLTKNGKVVVCYFGEGAASEGDAFTAFNFAATLGCPIIFICRNNGYAISTPVNEQYHGDGIINRGPALGMAAIRVDGNDLFAMHNATKHARELCLSENRPVLIEAMTYRIGHHSTSDDSSVYRSLEEVNYWDKTNNPIIRLQQYLLRKDFLTEEDEKQMRAECRKQVMQAFQRAEAKKKPNPAYMFTDVYKTMTPRLRRQMESTEEHLKRHSKQYPLDKYEQFNSSLAE